MKRLFSAALFFSLVVSPLAAQQWEVQVPWESALMYKQMQEEKERSKIALEKGIRKMTEKGVEAKVYKRDTTVFAEDEFATTYTFDRQGRLLSMKFENTVYYNRDEKGRLVSIYLDDVAITENEFDAQGRLSSTQYQTNDTTRWRVVYTYNAAGKCTEEKHYSLVYHKFYKSRTQHGALADSMLYSRHIYRYNKKGFVESKWRRQQLSYKKDTLIREFTFTCDAAGNIIQVEQFSAPCPIVIKYSSTGELLEYTQCADYGRSRRALKTTLLYLDGRMVSLDQELDNGKKYFEWPKYDKEGRPVSIESTYGVGKYTLNSKGLPVKLARSGSGERVYMTLYTYEYW